MAKSITAATGYDVTWDALFADIADGPLREAGLAGSNGELISAPAKDDVNDSNGDWLREHKIMGKRICGSNATNEDCYNAIAIKILGLFVLTGHATITIK